jgi:beta-lactamase regulating signal transducer with metallopeptidase domain
MPEALLAIALPDTSWAFDSWLLRTTLAGGVVLCLGSLWMVFTRQPSHRQRIGELALLTALLVALPAALPAWWSLPVAQQNSATQRAIFGQLPALNPNPGKMVELVELPVDRNQHAWEDEEAFDFDVAAVIKAAEEEQEALNRQDGKSLVIPEANDTDTKGFIAPITSTNWLRWTLRIIGIGYFGLVLVLLGRCVIGYYGLWRYWRLRRPAPAHVCTALAELEPDEARRPRIGVNPLVPGPVSYGLWKPTILLPPKFCNEGDPEKLRWILAHELTHLQRRDAWSCLLLALGGALYFHVPWFWWMKRHVRLAQEYLADAAAVKLSNAVEYAQYLVSLTTLASRPTLASSQAAGVFETPSDLYRRVDMLLHQRSALDRSAPRWWTLTAAASFLALAACTSGINLNRLYADDTDTKVVKGVAIVTSDDDDDDDKVEKQRSVIRVDGKLLKTDDKNVVIVQDEKNKGDKVKEVRGFFTGDHQAKIDEAIKKLDATLEKLPKQLDADTRARLEELKKTLNSMKANHGEWHFVAPKISGEWQGKIQEQARKAGDDAKRAGEEARRVAEVYRAKAQEYAENARAQAQNAEKAAKAAQEKALKRWTEAKDGKGRDDAIAELEKAIEAKEKALRALKTDGKLGEARVQDDRRRMVERVVTGRGEGTASSSPKGRFGVVVGDIDNNLRGHLDLAEGQGLMVNEVIDPSPAWNKGNGLRSSDILIELGGKSIPSNQDKFRELVSKLPEGDVRAVVIRKGKKITINGIKLPAAPKASNVVIRHPDDVHVEGKPLHLELANVEGKPLRLTTRFSGDVKTAPLASVRSLNLDGVAKVEGVVKVDKADVVVDNVKIAPADVLVRPMTTFRATTVPVFQGAQVGGKPRLGVSLAEVPETVASQVELADDRGLLVIEVTDGSAAKKAGILKNDILIEFADKPVTRNHPEFTKMVKELKPGKYTATVVRKGKEIRIRDIQLTDAKADTAKAKDWMVDEEEKADKAKPADKAKKADKADKSEKDGDFFPQARNNNRAFNLARNNGNTSITLNDGKFTIKSDRDGKAITIIGKVVEGKATPDSITIKGEDSEKKYKAVKDVPAEDRANVEKLLATSRVTPSSSATSMATSTMLSSRRHSRKR